MKKSVLNIDRRDSVFPWLKHMPDAESRKSAAARRAAKDECVRRRKQGVELADRAITLALKNAKAELGDALERISLRYKRASLTETLKEIGLTAALEAIDEALSSRPIVIGFEGGRSSNYGSIIEVPTGQHHTNG